MYLKIKALGKSPKLGQQPKLAQPKWLRLVQPNGLFPNTNTFYQKLIYRVFKAYLQKAGKILFCRILKKTFEKKDDLFNLFHRRTSGLNVLFSWREYL